MKKEAVLKRLGVKPVMFQVARGKGTGLGQEEVLFVLGKVAHEQPLGAALLQFEGLGDEKSKREALVLLLAVTSELAESWGVVPGDLVHETLCRVAVDEVTQGHPCSCCSGTGSVRDADGVMVCSECSGTGLATLSNNALWKKLQGRVAFSRASWYRVWYDRYMQLVDVCYRANSAAMALASELCERELAG